MSSMEDVLDRLRALERRLEEMQEGMSASLDRLEARRADLQPWWTDRTAVNFDTHWQPMEESLRSLVGQAVPDCLDFVRRKIRLLEEYLEEM